MQKIGIITFHASHNYGSMLQAYALQSYLQHRGCKVKIINLRPLEQKKLYAHPFSIKYNSRKDLLKNIISFKHCLSNIKKWHKFENFMSEHFSLTEECSSYKDVENIIPKYNFDLLISGGDQIWNQKCKDFEISFLLPFNTNTHKISYAPSMGKRAALMGTPPYIDKIAEYLPQYDLISVREPDAATMLKEKLGRDVSVVADPTFLLSPQDYEKLIGERIVKGPYIFYYTPSHLKGTKAYQATTKYAQEKNLKLVSSNSKSWQKDIIAINDSGPLEFLNLLYYADFVCGQSFHLAVFSLIFHKQFAIINGDKDPRMVNLLTNCKIPHRGINQENPDFTQMEEIDYKFIDLYINKLQSTSISFIEKALSL